MMEVLVCFYTILQVSKESIKLYTAINDATINLVDKVGNIMV